ncbi:hypothetical protein HYT91_03605 [Candidatus Pacearchaeota archaeon]|nr:hypothetical protein [Candidatus Pacearchaeota archaeon]
MMRTLTKLLIPFLAGSIAFLGCNDLKSGEKNLEDSLFLAKDSVVLDKDIIVKFYEKDNSFKQYNEKGLLIREVKYEQLIEGNFLTADEKRLAANKVITDNQYNEKDQLIKSASLGSDKEKLTRTDSILYQYDEKGRLYTKEFFPALGYDSGSALFIYAYNDKKQIEKETRIYILEGTKGKKSKWVETIYYAYDSKGNQIREQRVDKNGNSYSLKLNDSTEIRSEDYDKDGKIDDFLYAKIK